MNPHALFFELSDDLFALVNADNQLAVTNGAWERVLGYSHELEALPFLELVHDDDRVLAERVFAGLWRAPGRQTFVVRLRSAGGSWWASRWTCQREDDQPMIAMVGVESDLEHTAPAAFDPVSKFETIGQLAAGVAHEINTPIQFITNNLEYLTDAFTKLTAAGAGTSPQLASFVEEVPLALGESLEGIARVARIVRSINEFAHPAGNDRRLVDLHRIIETSIVISRSQWKSVADIEVDLDPELPLVPAYGDGLGQVMLNLLINASHAIEDTDRESKGTIHISTSVDTTSDMVEIRVTDTGSGMDPTVKERIFEPFFTTKGLGRGTGQGLALAYNEITERHGGAIDVSSVVGKGSEFCLRLPLSSNSAETVQEVAP